LSLLGRMSEDLRLLAQRTSTGVVGLEQGRGQGSGTILTHDGYVLTNAHVARAAQGLRLRLPLGLESKGDLVGRDERTDLAVVHADLKGAAPLPLADSRRLGVGEIVMAIGNPFGFERSVSLGVVSALFRDLPTPGGGVLEGLIQTDAAVNPGNSGGPLVNTEGFVVGINTAMIPWAQGIGFAVPAHTASWVAAVLIQRGEVIRPYLGVAARSEVLGGTLSQEAGMVRAVKIVRVEDETPASASGLKAEDVLLTANESPILTIDDLQRVMVLAGAEPIRLEILRRHERGHLLLHPRPRARAA